MTTFTSKLQFSRFLSNKNVYGKTDDMANMAMANVKHMQNANAMVLASNMHVDVGESSSSGIAELERAFGNAERCAQLIGNSTRVDQQSLPGGHLEESGDYASDSSDIDCGELEAP